MTSLNHQQAERDAESFDNDRHEGRYDRAAFTGAGRDLSDPRWEENTVALAEAVAQLEMAFGKWDRAQGRFVPVALAMEKAA